MDDFDTYPAVMDDEEEQRRKKDAYAPVAGPALGAVQPSNYAPAGGLIDTTPPAPDASYLGAGSSRLDLMRPRPRPSEYQPPEHHGLGKVGMAAAGIIGGAGVDDPFRLEKKAAQGKYTAAAGAYDTEFNQQKEIADLQRQETGERSQAELRGKQGTQYDMVPLQIEGQTEPIYVQKKDVGRIQQELARGRSAATVADTKATSAEKIQGKSKSDVAEEGYASKERIAALADRTKRELGMANLAIKKAAGPKAPPEVAKAHGVLEGSISRLNIMNENKAKALQGDQQAMLSLLANHIGMTMGLVPGARINRQIYQEAEDSAPWLQRVEAHFDKDGFLSGVVLTPGQMEQMNDLAVNRLREDRRNLTDTENYYGFHGQNTPAVTPPAGGGGTKPPAGASDEVLDQGGKLIGHAVKDANGKKKFVPLPKVQ